MTPQLRQSPRKKPVSGTLARFAGQDRGATAIDYTVIMAVIGGMLIATLGPIGESIAGHFNTIRNAIVDVRGGDAGGGDDGGEEGGGEEGGEAGDS